MTIAIRFYERNGEVLLAACDEELLGKTFKSGEMRLTVSKTFYHRESVTEEEFPGIMNRATAMNLVGDRTISAAVEAGLVSPEGILRIEGVGHAQVVRM